MIYSLSNTTDINLDQLKAAEKEMGVTLLALSGHEAAPAQLDDDKVQKIQSLERELGCTLLAVSA